MQNKIYGMQGEQKALKYLKHKKYKIVQTNYINALGEIDIIAKTKTHVVFVEVKSRSNQVYGTAGEAVNSAKQRKIRQVAQIFLKQNSIENALCRFDVLEVYENQINHIENAF